jgi:hypothetical protein
MTVAGYAPSPHDWSPSKAKPPKSFEGIELYPAVSVKIARAKVEKFGELFEREDELGACFVEHFQVLGTLVMFYQSALDAKDRWTVFVDMVGCVAESQIPTQLGRSVVRHLTAGAVKPEWVNEEADREYRSRRRKLSPAGHLFLRIAIKSLSAGVRAGSIVGASSLIGNPGSASKKRTRQEATLPAKEAVAAQKAGLSQK